MNIVIQIPLTNYPTTFERRMLARELRALASHIEEFDSLAIMLAPDAEKSACLNRLWDYICLTFPESVAASGVPEG